MKRKPETKERKREESELEKLPLATLRQITGFLDLKDHMRLMPAFPNPYNTRKTTAQVSNADNLRNLLYEPFRKELPDELLSGRSSPVFLYYFFPLRRTGNLYPDRIWRNAARESGKNKVRDHFLGGFGGVIQEKSKSDLFIIFHSLIDPNELMETLPDNLGSCPPIEAVFALLPRVGANAWFDVINRSNLAPNGKGSEYKLLYGLRCGAFTPTTFNPRGNAHYDISFAMERLYRKGLGVADFDFMLDHADVVQREMRRGVDIYPTLSAILGSGPDPFPIRSEVDIIRLFLSFYCYPDVAKWLSEHDEVREYIFDTRRTSLIRNDTLVEKVRWLLGMKPDSLGVAELEGLEKDLKTTQSSQP